MRRVQLLYVAFVLVLCAAALGGCASESQQPAAPSASESPKAVELDAAIATATQSVSDASAYIMGLQQPLEGVPEPTDLEKLTTTLNLAATQTGAAQVATAQSALDQFNAGIAKVESAAKAAPQDSGTQGQYQQLVATLQIGQNALDQALN